jgi:hypothetical protein
MLVSRRTGLRFATVSAVLLGLSLWSVGGAAAKFGVRVSVSPSQPRIARPVSVLIRTGPVGTGACRMRLVAVAPGTDRYHALDAFIIGGYSVNGPFGSTFHRLRPTPRLGFLARMQRAGPTEWRTTVKFPRPGNWRLIVPNWCAPGVASPLPADRTVTVRYGRSSAFPTGWAAGGGVGTVLLAGMIFAAWRRRPHLLQRLPKRHLRSRYRAGTPLRRS